MQKGCIIAISILAIVIGITVMVLYFTLGSGDNGGNNVNIDSKGENKGKERGDNNIIQKTNQGGSTFLSVLASCISTGKH